MFPTPFTADLARAHRDDLLEQAARYRLGRAARIPPGSARPPRWRELPRLLGRTAPRRGDSEVGRRTRSDACTEFGDGRQSWRVHALLGKCTAD